jgi:phosphatidylserine/phosphatidylglycerophosphate/cardiolipin synthase-like enzyme
MLSKRNTRTVIAFVVLIVVAVLYALSYFADEPATTPAPSADQLATTQAPLASTPRDWWEVYFTDPLTINDPNNYANSIEQKLIDKINAAQSSIHIASFEFNLTPVAEALIAAHQRGVDVRWVTDDEHGLEADADPDGGQFAMLTGAGIEVRDDGRTALMHNKFWIFDRQTVWTGSTNITINGIFKQNNNVIVLHSPEIAAIYEREFEEMWAGQFGPRSPSTVEQQSALVNGSPVQVLFSSEDDVVNRIIAYAQEAQTSIRFLAFSFTDYPLANTMIQRAAAGVDVKGVYEKVGSDGQGAELGTFLCAKVPVRQDGNGSFMHNKLIIVDNRIVITGSLNFSSSADEANDENVIIVDNPDIAALYLEEFERIWTLGSDPDPADFPCP